MSKDWPFPNEKPAVWIPQGVENPVLVAVPVLARDQGKAAGLELLEERLAAKVLWWAKREGASVEDLQNQARRVLGADAVLDLDPNPRTLADAVRDLVSGLQVSKALRRAGVDEALEKPQKVKGKADLEDLLLDVDLEMWLAEVADPGVAD